MTGIICMWHGPIVDIPDGWALCDGQNDTPDLRDKFVIGVPFGLNPGRTGGDLAHHHVIDANTNLFDTAHSHANDDSTDGPDSGACGYANIGGANEAYEDHVHMRTTSTEAGGSNHQHACDFNSDPAGHKPPYYEIAFIMKV